MSCLLSVGDKNSLVHGFISDGIFEGKIHTSNDEYHVESVKKYFSAPQDFHSVIFRRSDVHYPHAYGSNCGISGKTKRWMEDVQRCVENYAWPGEGVLPKCLGGGVPNGSQNPDPISDQNI